LKTFLSISAFFWLLTGSLWAGQPQYNAQLTPPRGVYIAPLPDAGNIPVISLDLTEFHPDFNLAKRFAPAPMAERSSFSENSITFTGYYYRSGTDYAGYYIPLTVDAPAYSEHRRAMLLERELQNVRAQALTKQQKDKKGGLVSFNIPIKSETFESIFGEGGAGLNVSGYHRITFSGRSSWTDGASTATNRQNKFPSLNMEQISRFDINGTIGSKITVSVTHDSKTDIPLANRLMLRYKGDEDDILKTVEAGNTTLSLPNTKFVGYSQSIRGLFGLKAEAQVGNLTVTAIASQEKGNSERTSMEAGTSARKKHIRDYGYAGGRIYDLGRIDTAIFDINEIDYFRGDSIITIEIYTASRSYGGINNESDPEARFWVDPDDTTVAPNEASTTRVKQVAGDDYFAHPTQFYVIFDNPNAGTNYQIGAYMIIRRSTGVIDTIGSLSEQPYQLKLIRPDQPANNLVSWNYEWRNVYSLQETNIDLDGLEINVFRGTNGTEDREDNLSHQNGVNYILILGLDRFDLSGNAEPDGLVDVKTPIVDPNLGLLIFPDRKPFDPGRDFVSGTSLDPRVPEIYDLLPSNSDMIKQSQYYIEISSRSRTAEVSLGKPNILEGSERITINGVEAVKGVDYNINYDFGQVTFLTEAGTDPNSVINIDFEYQPFISAQKKSLFGVRGEYAFSENLKFGSTFLYKSDKATDRKPKVGQETAKAYVWDADISLKMQPNLLTSAANALPLFATEAKSNLQVSAEIARSFPNPNVDGTAYIDDFEGSRDSYSLGVYRSLWTVSSPPISLDSTRFRSKVIWYNPINQIPTEQIWNREVATTESSTQTLWATFTPADSVMIVDTTGGISYQDADPALSWAGIIRGMTAGAINQDRAQLLEMRLKGDYGVLHIELGNISEDVNGNGEKDTEDKLQNGIRNGIIDAGEDTGLDGLFNEEEPGYDLITNPDPNGDDYFYISNNDYSRINGTEGNKDDIDRLGRPDTEDINRDENFNLQNNYFSFTIDLAGDGFLVDSSEFNGWRTFRIPIREPENSDTAGDPQWSLINFVRIWFESPSGTPFTVAFAAMDLIQSNWDDTLITFDPTTDTKFNVAVINTQENSNYEPPPGVAGYYDKTSETREPEQSLLFKFETLQPGDSCLASRVLFDTPSYVGYRTLNMYVHGPDNIDSLLFFFRLGSDTANYYEFRTILEPGWDPANEVTMDFNEITILKDFLIQAQSENPDTNQIFSADSTYRVYGSPTLTRVKYLANGLVNISRDSAYSRPSGEVWINELRLSDVRKDPGMAARVAASGNVADLFSYNAGYEYQDSYFRGISSSTRGGSTENLGSGKTRTTYNWSVRFGLEKFLPRSLGANLPVSYSFNKSTMVPRLRFGTDIILPPELQDAESEISTSKSITISESFNKNTKNPIFSLLLNRFNSNFSYTRSEGRSPKLPMSLNESYRLGGNYNLSIKKVPHIKPLFWTKPFPILKRLGNSKFYFFPETHGLTGSLNRNFSISENSSGVITQSLRRTFDGSYKVNYKISDNLNTNFNMVTQRDLNNPETIKFSLDPKKFKLGRETGYSQGFGATYNPAIFTFLTHNINYSVSYREVLNVRDSTLNADASKSYGVAGVFDFKKFFGTAKGGAKPRPRKGPANKDKVEEKADTTSGLVDKDGKPVKKVIVAEGKGNVLGSMIRPFKRVMGFLTGWINPINYDYNEKYGYGYTGLLERAQLKFRFGLTDELGARVSNNLGTNTRSTAVGKATGLTLRSGTTFLGGLKTDVTFNRKISRDIIKITNPQKVVSTTFPDIKFTIQPLRTITFLNPLIRRFSPRTSYSRVTGETENLQSGRITSKQLTINQRPLLALNLNVLRGVTMEFSTDHTVSESETYNSQTGSLTNRRRNIQNNYNYSIRYSFTSPNGINIPVFGKIRFKSTMTLSCDISYQTRKEESAEGENPYVSTGTNNDLSVSPMISYTFSTQIKGGLTAKWQDSNDTQLNRKSHTRELRFWVEIKF